MFRNLEYIPSPSLCSTLFTLNLECPCDIIILKLEKGFSFFFSLFLIYFYFFILFFNFTILYWFCHISTWIHHRYTRVSHPEPSSLLPPCTIPLGRPSVPAPSIQYRASNLDWWLVSYMILYMFQCQRFSKIIYCKTVTSSIVLLKFQSIQSISDHYIPSSVKNYPNTTEKFSKCCKLIYVVEAKDSP